MCLWPERTLLEEASLILLQTRHILGISSAFCRHKQRDSGSCRCRLLSAVERPCRRRRLQGAGQRQVFLSQGKRDIAAPGMKTITFVKLLCEETKFRLSMQQLAREHAVPEDVGHSIWKERGERGRPAAMEVRSLSGRQVPDIAERVSLLLHLLSLSRPWDCGDRSTNSLLHESPVDVVQISVSNASAFCTEQRAGCKYHGHPFQNSLNSPTAVTYSVAVWRGARHLKNVARNSACAFASL